MEEVELTLEEEFQEEEGVESTVTNLKLVVMDQEG